MTRLTLPKNPQLGDRHSHGDYTYSWDGTKWTSINAGVRNIFNTQEDLECATVLLGEWVLVTGNNQEYIIEANSAGTGSITVCNGLFANKYVSSIESAYNAHMTVTGNPHGTTKADVDLANVNNYASGTWTTGVLSSEINATEEGVFNIVTSELVSVNQSITNHGSSIATLESDYTTLDTKVTGIDGRVTVLEAVDLVTLDSTVASQGNDITAIELRVDTLETTQDTIEDDVTSLSNKVIALENLDIANNSADILQNTSDISGNTDAINTVNIRVDSSDVLVNAIDVRVNDLESARNSPDLINLRDSMFPVGSVYITLGNTNPGTFLGGTWTSFSEGRVLMGVGGGNDGGTSRVFNADTTGGKYEHTLNSTEVPNHTHSHGLTLGPGGEHTHSITANNTGLMSKGGTTNSAFESGTGGNFYKNTTLTNSTEPDHNHALTGQITATSGGGNSHNNIQPYQTVYFWQCVARDEE